jgi:hypothetical protein
MTAIYIIIVTDIIYAYVIIVILVATILVDRNQGSFLSMHNSPNTFPLVSQPHPNCLIVLHNTFLYFPPSYSLTLGMIFFLILLSTIDV